MTDLGSYRSFGLRTFILAVSLGLMVLTIFSSIVLIF